MRVGVGGAQLIERSKKSAVSELALTPVDRGQIVSALSALTPRLQACVGDEHGIADVTLGVGGHSFPVGVTPTVVIRANDGASHTISTSSGNPSYLSQTFANPLAGLENNMETSPIKGGRARTWPPLRS